MTGRGEEKERKRFLVVLMCSGRTSSLGTCTQKSIYRYSWTGWLTGTVVFVPAHTHQQRMLTNVRSSPGPAGGDRAAPQRAASAEGTISG